VDALIDSVQDIHEQLDYDRGSPVHPGRIDPGHQSAERFSAAGEVEIAEPAEGRKLQIRVVSDAVEERSAALVLGHAKPPAGRLGPRKHRKTPNNRDVCPISEGTRECTGRPGEGQVRTVGPQVPGRFRIAA